MIYDLSYRTAEAAAVVHAVVYVLYYDIYNRHDKPSDLLLLPWSHVGALRFHAEQYGKRNTKHMVSFFPFLFSLVRYLVRFLSSPRRLRGRNVTGVYSRLACVSASSFNVIQSRHIYTYIKVKRTANASSPFSVYRDRLVRAQLTYLSCRWHSIRPCSFFKTKYLLVPRYFSSCIKAYSFFFPQSVPPIFYITPLSSAACSIYLYTV